jgi:hydrogenase/urease accessory protein HupE
MLRSGHRHVARFDADGRTTTPVLLVDAPEAELAVGPSAAPVAEKGLFLPMLRLGVEHILTGFDHLTFLFALLLVPMRTRLLLAVITSFTLAHSVSLALAVLGVWTPSPRIVEPLIAASIVFVGVENLFLSKPERRVALTSAFGFVHGFGFAGALLEAQLERRSVPVALFAFNLGVEAGQLAVLALVLPILLYLRRRPETRAALERDGKAYRALSVAVAAAGAVWLALRVF